VQKEKRKKKNDFEEKKNFTIKVKRRRKKGVFWSPESEN
jgi:hypothetical protein